MVASFGSQKSCVPDGDDGRGAAQHEAKGLRDAIGIIKSAPRR